jgi:hypothetical protein
VIEVRMMVGKLAVEPASQFVNEKTQSKTEFKY